MFGSAISLIDRIIQLAMVKERNRERHFKNFVEPLFSDAEIIARDYSVLLEELFQRLSSEDDIKTTRRWLEERRRLYRPLRIKVRALLEDGLVFRGNTTLDDFKRGIWGLMKGGVSLVEDGHGSTREYGFGDHTVLDMLKRFPFAQSPSGNSLQSRSRLIDQAHKQQAAIDRAWEDVVTSYRKLKHDALGE